MTITRRPPRPAAAKPAKPAAVKKTAAAPKKTAEKFIESAEATAPEAAPPPAEIVEKKGKKHKDKDKGKDKGKGKEHKKRKDKEAVLIRFEDDQLSMMDARAAALGLSRAAWLRMVVAKALMGKKN
jgi:hypothetical protein